MKELTIDQRLKCLELAILTKSRATVADLTADNVMKVAEQYAEMVTRDYSAQHMEQANRQKSSRESQNH